ncbi:hypothetical protein NFI00_000137 [Salmonella enterica]|nr:hypothetical protein [Salmonella enterica subsp. enterica serovar Minnesota]EJI5696434.1 hypothetical protein [Salmonella enterica]
MTTLSQVVPGKVNNRGVNDRSIPDYSTEPATTPLHMPVIPVVTPKGEFGTQWINAADFQNIYGNIFDHKSPYYNPTAALIQNMISGGQASIGVRRLSVNKQVARIALSAFVTKKKVTDWKRNYKGMFELDTNGDKIKIGEFDGLEVYVAVDPEAANKEPGELTIRTIPAVAEGDSDTYVYPLFELLAGVGDVYNLNGVHLGVKDSALNWKGIAQFVEATGVFPFFMRQFIDSATGGARNYVKDKSGKDTTQFTLFEVENESVKYSLRECIGAYTGGNVNRPTTLRPAPFGDVISYNDNIEELAQLMYAVEKPHNTGLVDGFQLNYRQMNPFTCTNHQGVPYYAIQGKGISMWDMSFAINAQYGVSPFLEKDGSLPSFATATTVRDPFGVLAGVDFPLTTKQGWEITNALMEADIQEFVDSLEQANYVRNRQSVFWDVGYTYAVKEKMMSILGARKDVMVFACATIWEPGKMNDVSSVYGRLSQLTAALRMYPESEYWGTQTMRAAVNIIEAKIIDEATGWYFSGNIDLAYMFARFAGNAAGTLSSARSPDHADNRLLTTMHSPNIEFEDDGVSSDNFDNGAITLRPYDITGALFRPCLPTVYKASIDSVLKDAVTAFVCVCLEKIGQDEWNVVCGDTTITAENYAALVKDGIERKSRDRLGGIAKSVRVDATYNENQPGGRAVLNTIIHAYFNKGKYMMNLDLFAYNEQDLEA